MKKLALSYLPGGQDKYLETLKLCLEFVKQQNPSYEQLESWFFQEFPQLKSKLVARAGINVILNMKLIERHEGNISLSDNGRQFLLKRDINIVFNKLDENFAFVKIVLQIISQGCSTIPEIFFKG